MREIWGPKPGDVREYIPEAFGNRLDPTPVRVWIRNPDGREKREILSVGETVRIAMGPDGPVLQDGKPMMEVGTSDSWRHQHDIVSRCVVKVENYRAPGGDAITNGAELAAHGETAIVAEVALEIRDALSLSAEKKTQSPSPPASSSEAPAPPDGSAGPVENQDSGRAEAATGPQ